jgi:hypothetical protein
MNAWWEVLIWRFLDPLQVFPQSHEQIMGNLERMAGELASGDVFI